MAKLIHIDFLPNFERDDFDLIKWLLVRPATIGFQSKKEMALRFLKKYFPGGEFFFFSSARGALTAFLKFYLSGNPRKKVATQAYSCLVVPNSIKFAGGSPVFIDIDEDSVNLSADDLKKKIDRETGVLIIQNTFGFPADYDSILAMANKKNLFVIENLAHSFGARYQGKYLGNFGDAALLSFGRSKVISSLSGGALILNNSRLAEQFKSFYADISAPSKLWLKKLLLHGCIAWVAKKHYVPWGKALMVTLRQLKLSALEIEACEKKGVMSKNYIAKMPDELFVLLAKQLEKLERFNQQRQRLAQIYKKEGIFHFGASLPQAEPIFLRYPMFTLTPNKVIEKFKRRNIYLGNWYQSVLAPVQTRLDRFGYYYGVCPKAEKLALGSYNLPTNTDVRPADAYLICEILKSVR